MIDSDELVPSKYRPVVVVSLSALFSSATMNGESVVSEDVKKLILKYTEKGYYILIDSHEPLLPVAERLRHLGVPFNGMSYDTYFGQAYAELRFKERVEKHARFDSVQAVIDEDITILSMCAQEGISTFQVMAGSVVFQSCNGRERYDKPCCKDVYKADVL